MFGKAIILAGSLWLTATLAAGASAREVFVAPTGRPGAAGTKEAPLDLATAFRDARRVPPGTTVWLAGGRYRGPFKAGVPGRKDAPIVYRARPGERATIVGGVLVERSHVWLWGLELVGPSQYGVNLRGGDGVKVINCVIHENGPAQKPARPRPSGQGIGGWDVGNDHEYYGNLLYHNGWFHLDHGIYSQNTIRHNTKRVVDNIIFENAGFGVHIYGQAPALANYHIEGNICFATSAMPRGPQRGQVNILVGGSKPLQNVVLRDNCTWHPDAAGSKRGVDIGYTSRGSTNLLVEDNYFTCGSNAMELKGVRDAVVRGNTFWAPAGMVLVTYAPGADKTKVVFERNTYIANGRFDLARWRRTIGGDADAVLVQGRNGRPAGLHVVKRVNQYEPERVHLAVYNWDRKETVRLPLEGLLKKGDTYRVVNVLDFYGKAVAQGTAEGAYVDLPMKGHRYEPDFGAYILFRPAPE